MTKPSRCRSEYRKRWAEANPGYYKKYRQANPDKYNEHNKAYRLRHRERLKQRSRAYQLKSKYGLSLVEYENHLLRCNYKCEICSTQLVKPCVDHCHETGKVRGILCVSCNAGLGNAKEDKQILENMIRYLTIREKTVEDEATSETPF